MDAPKLTSTQASGQAFACMVDAPVAAPPAGKRSPGGWPCFALVDAAVRLRFAAGADEAARLRLAVGLDVREPVSLAVTVGPKPDATPVGMLDAAFASELQVLDLPLSIDQTRTAVDAGLWIERVGGQQPVYLLGRGAADPFAPHLLVPAATQPWTAFLQRLDSLASLTQFGWMEGCVLNGLADLGLTRTLDRHLDLFFPDGRLVAQDFRSRPIDDGLTSTESTNAFTALAQRRPAHPALNLMLGFFESQIDADGVIRGDVYAAEHLYTVAHPLAVLARTRDDAALAEWALHQARRHVRVLYDADGFWLRAHPDGQRTFHNWSRGVAWYLLGLVRTLDALPERLHEPELLAVVRAAADQVARWQRSDGLWTSYLDDPATDPETSGSAGIAAALALAAKRGWLGSDAIDRASHCLQGLEAHLLPDGMLSGMSQTNKAEAGEDLQRSSVRIIGAAAMGLTAQLIAALPAERLPAALRRPGLR